MANEAKIVGSVALVEGIAFATNENGEQRRLKVGDPVFEGEVIVTSEGGRVELVFDHGGSLLLRSSETVTLDSTVFDATSSDFSSGGLLSRVQEFTGILDAINEGRSLDNVVQETAAGVKLEASTSAFNASADQGSSFIRLMRTVEGVAAPLSYEYETNRQPLEYIPTDGAWPSIWPGRRISGAVSPFRLLHRPDRT